jgi:hypothetical protein
MNPKAIATLGEIVAEAIWGQIKAQVANAAPDPGLRVPPTEAPPPSEQPREAEMAQTRTGRDF